MHCYSGGIWVKMRNLFESGRSGLRMPAPYRNSLILNRIADSSQMVRDIICSFLWRRAEGAVKRLSSNSPSAQPAHVLAIPHYTTGIGHSVMELNTAVVRAQRWGLTYLHMPLREPWESFFAFGDGEDLYADVMARKPIIVDLPYVPLPDDPVQEERLKNLLCGFRSEQLVVFRLFPKTSVFAQSEGSSFLKNKYLMRRLKDPVENLLQDGKVNVAIHIRRGDIMAMMRAGVGAWEERYVDLDYFVNLAKQLEALCGKHRVCFHVFSQGAKPDFEAFDCLSDVAYHLDYDVFASFHNLAIADVLIGSPSSFSYLPSLFSEGVKIFCYPFWHDLPLGKDWVRYEDGDHLNSGRVRDKLAAALKHKCLI